MGNNNNKKNQIKETNIKFRKFNTFKKGYSQYYLDSNLDFMTSEEEKETILENETTTKSNTTNPTELPFRKIKGLTIRKRVDPSVSSARDSYQIERSIKHTLKGKRIYFQIKIGNNILYSTKMKGKRPEDPLPIAKGSEMHYSSEQFAGYLLSGNKHTIFSLRTQTTFGKELLSILFESPNGDKSLPKKISVTFFLKDSLIPKKLVNLDPSMTTASLN